MIVAITSGCAESAALELYKRHFNRAVCLAHNTHTHTSLEVCRDA